ncbi:hypothetical protein IPG41_01470 [Candidatus Peregrinibacteria bacterium]|nr:MAG: hypothetical protein IPG41_01470 [Candidatus Peregrinibacteria bacterium]
MKNLATIMALVLLAFPGCSTSEPSGTESEITNDHETTGDHDQGAPEDSEKEVACEDSGGRFSDETCECPDETYGDAEWPLYTYDEETGYCIDALGIPGGALGEEEKENHPLAE